MNPLLYDEIEDNALCHYRLVKVHEVVRLVSEGTWVRPTFQRAFVWKPWQLCELADSLWRGYPIGPLLLWQDPDSSRDHIRWWVADGQHRLLSLCILFGQRPFGWRSEQESPSVDVINRFDIRFDVQTTTPPFFKLAASAGDGLRFVPLARLLRLNVESAKGRQELERIAQSVLIDSDCAGLSLSNMYKRLLQVCRIQERQLLTTVLRISSREEVIEVFNRLNSRGLRFRRLLLRLIAARLPFN